MKQYMCWIYYVATITASKLHQISLQGWELPSIDTTIHKCKAIKNNT
jgi:hypothetical protein